MGVGASGVIVDDLTFVFGLISGISECLIIFILPVVFYLRADYLKVKHYKEAI